MTADLSMTRLSRFAIMVAAGVIAAACSSSPNPAAPTPAVATVSAVVVTGASTSGLSFQLTATARMSDGTTRGATSTATWSSSNGLLATVSSTGMVTVVGGGEFDVRATYEGVTGSLHLVIASLPVVAVNVSGPSSSSTSFQLTALARLSDGSTQDVTGGATWVSSSQQLATVTATGYVSVVAAGDVDLGATYQGVAGSLRVSVSLPRTFVLSGAITGAAPDGQPIAGARVQVFGGATDHAISDARGMFVFRVPAGRTIVEVSMDGYHTWSTEIFIVGDTDLPVILSPTPLTVNAGVSETAHHSEGV